MTTNEITTDALPTRFVVPATGEVVNIGDADQMRVAATTAPEILGLMLDTIDDHIRQAQDVRAYVADFLVERMDSDATQTLHAGKFTLTVNGSSDEYETYDADDFSASLSLLVAEGIITQAAMDKAIRTKREVSKSGLNSLRALRNPSVDEAISAATQIATRRRRVTVKRAR